MTGWIIAGAVVASLLTLLLIPVRVRFEYSDELRLKISWLFITIVKIPARKRKMKRRDKKAKKDAKAAAKAAAQAEKDSVGEKPTEPSEGRGDEAKGADGGKKSLQKDKPAAKPKGKKLTLNDIFALCRLVWGSLGKPLRRVLKATRIIGFRLKVTVGGDDAASAAIKYGGVNAAAGSALAFLDRHFTLKKPIYDISCDFLSEETYAECEFTAKLSAVAGLAFLLWVLGRLVRNYISDKEAAKAVGKLRRN